MKNFIKSQKSARRAHSLGLSHLLFAAAIVASSLFVPQNVVAQVQGPAIEVPTWGPYVMIGKNDLNDATSNNHILTFGRGNLNTTTGTGNCGLWYISGSRNERFIIGRAYNTITDVPGYTTPNGRPAMYTKGRQMIVIDPNMNVGIDKWNPEISYKLDVADTMRVKAQIIASDRRYKRDIKPLNNIDKLFEVNPVQYKPSSEALHEQLKLYTQSAGAVNDPDYDAIVGSYKDRIVVADADTSTSFGFIAQELREIYPNLVSEDRQGFLSVNYIGLIPVLVDAIKTQQTQIDELNSKINELKGDGFVKSNTTEVATLAKLYQNNPNPFDTQTEIKYYIPAVAVNATICVYDMVGAEVLKLEIRGRESGSIVIDAGQLRAGMYMYALLVDGKEVDVKRMILTGK